jgi:metal-responsive CopG/Arc/MetJ family transcriptional regulator
MRITISIPDPLFKEAEAAAKALGLTHTKLIQIALREFLQRRRDEEVTASINRYIEKYGAELSEEDEAWIAHGQATMLRTLEELEAEIPRGKRKKRARP